MSSAYANSAAEVLDALHKTKQMSSSTGDPMLAFMHGGIVQVLCRNGWDGSLQGFSFKLLNWQFSHAVTDTIPSFIFRDYRGSEATLENWGGRPVFFNFTGTIPGMDFPSSLLLLPMHTNGRTTPGSIHLKPEV